MSIPRYLTRLCNFSLKLMSGSRGKFSRGDLNIIEIEIVYYFVTTVIEVLVHD